MHLLKHTRRSLKFRCNENTWAKHELRSAVSEAKLIRELTPHCSHKWLSSPWCWFHRCVDVIDQVISQIEGMPDRFSYSRCLPPWFTLIYNEGVISWSITKQFLKILFDLIISFRFFDCLLSLANLAVVNIDPANWPWMSSKERVPDSKLIEHDEKVVVRIAKKARHVGTAERMTSITKLQDHWDWAL